MRDNLSGYQIQKFMNITTNFCNTVKYGSIHVVLKKFESDGLVTAEEIVNNGRLTKVYSISETGRKAFVDHYSEPLRADLVRSDLGNRLFFASEFIPKEELVTLLQEYITNTNREIERLEKLKDEQLLMMDKYQLFCNKVSIERRKCNIRLYSELIDELQAL